MTIEGWRRFVGDESTHVPQPPAWRKTRNSMTTFGLQRVIDRTRLNMAIGPLRHPFWVNGAA